MAYDAVIIGSGIGGLTAGAYLSKYGKRVLVCEQHARPGGYFTSFRRQGYTFDGGTQSVEDIGMFRPMLRQLGLDGRVKLAKSRFAVASPEFFHPLESLEDLRAFYDMLIRFFPADRCGLAETRDLALAFCRIFRDVLASAPNPFFQTPWGFLRENLPALARNLSALRAAGDFYRLLDEPLAEWMRRRVGNPDPVNIICDIGFYGMSVSFGLAFIYFMMDYYYPLGGFQAISDALASLIKEKGGEVRCRARVEQILVEGSRAVGVRLEGGEEVRAPYVISGADMRRTFLEMLPASCVPSSYRRRLLDARPAHSMFTVYLGLDIPPEELGNRGFHHVVIFPGLFGTDFSGIDDDIDFYRKCPVMVSMPSAHDPSLAPPGKSVMCIQYYATPGFAGGWGMEGGKPTPRHRELREMVADQMITITERVIPDIKERIEVKVTATPFTYERFTLNSAGATIGWSKHPRESFSPFIRSFLDFRTPVRNLYQVGHWAFGPGGIPGGLINGKMVSDIIRLRSRLGL
jgi:phytoene dehydrogenase-like protein